MDEPGEVNFPPFIACGKASEVFEAAEAAFDAIAVFVERSIVRNDDLARAIGRDHGCRIHFVDALSQGIAVIGFISKDGLARLPFEQSGGLRDVASLPGRHDEAKRSSERVGEHVNLGGQSTSGTPQRLILSPPFPFADC